MILQEQLRPTSLQDFIGNESSIDSLHAYFRGIVEADAALLISDPGLGKTTLSHCFAHHYNLVPLEVNGSDERNKKDILKVIRMRKSQSIGYDFTTKKKLLILDEIEPIKTELLLRILKERGPKILICNDGNLISYKVKEKCHIINLRPPKKIDLKEFITKRLNRELPDKDTLKEITSWRDCINWYYGGDVRTTKMLTELQEAQEIFTTDTRRNYSITTERLLEYYIHNGGDQQVASLLNIKMSINTFMKKVVRDVLFSFTLPSVNTIGYYGPRRRKERQKVKFLGFD